MSENGVFQFDVESFVRDGFVRIPFSHDALIQRVSTGFMKFLEKPLEERMRWFLDKGKPRKDDSGYTHRTGGPKDSKGYFHYRDPLEDLLEEAGVDFSPEYQWLVDQRRLRYLCLDAMQNCLTALDQDPRFKRFGLVDRFNKANGEHVLRSLSYDPVPVGGDLILAQRHWDKSAVTLQMEVTQPGYVAIRNGKELFLEGVPGTALFFGGHKLEVATNGALEAMLHEVVERRRELAPPCPLGLEERRDPELHPRPGRQSVVAFGHFKLSDSELTKFRELHAIKPPPHLVAMV